MKAVVYHQPMSIFGTFWLKPEKSRETALAHFDRYEKVLEVEVTEGGEAGAEEVFDLTNNPSRDHDRMKAGCAHLRSFSSGDVVEVGGERWLCLSIGWTKL
jgi:hypothetical protein